MPSELLRDLLIVNRRIFDEAVANLRAEASSDIDRALREESLWAYEQTHRSPKSELRQINEAAQDRADGRVKEIQTAAASTIDALKSQHHEREQRIRAYCDQLQVQNQKSDDDKYVPPGLSPLTAPIPPKLAEVLGYPGQSRFVGFYHESVRDEAEYDDGRSVGTGESYAFDRWRGHAAVASHLEDINLGGSDLDATHWLIIDRERDVTYVALASTAQSFLQKQHPTPPELQPSDSAVIHRRTQEHQRAVDAMFEFLDGAAEANPDSPPPDGP